MGVRTGERRFCPGGNPRDGIGGGGGNVGLRLVDVRLWPRVLVLGAKQFLEEASLLFLGWRRQWRRIDRWRSVGLLVSRTADI